MNHQPHHLKSAAIDQATGQAGEWIEANAFLELAVSNRRLWRCDQPAEGLCGLVDRDTGQQYWISRERLFTRPPNCDAEPNA